MSITQHSAIFKRTSRTREQLARDGGCVVNGGMTFSSTSPAGLELRTCRGICRVRMISAARLDRNFKTQTRRAFCRNNLSFVFYNSPAITLALAPHLRQLILAFESASRSRAHKYFPTIPVPAKEQFRHTLFNFHRETMSPDTYTPAYKVRPKPGLKKSPPYWYSYTSMAKGRWIGRELLEIVSTEFRDRSMEYYVRLS